MNDEQERELLEQVRKNVRAEFGIEAESVVEGLRTYVRDQRQIEKDRREKTGRNREKRLGGVQDEEVEEPSSWEVLNEKVKGDRRSGDESGNELEREDMKERTWEEEEESGMMDREEEGWKKGRKKSLD